MLGVWMGRIFEEEASDRFNRTLIEVLKDIYDANKNARGEEFVNVADPEQTDPVIRDAWDTMGAQIKEDAQAVFGEPDFLPVMKDQVVDAMGFRAAGITDAWTGVSRWSPEVQRVVRETATVFFKKDAFKYLARLDKLARSGVSLAKTNIIIKSVVVALDNVTSNQLHLMTWGIDPVTLVKKNREKFLEITEFVKNREEITRLQVELAAVIHDRPRSARLEARIEALEDANRGLSIAPLLEAGEFSTISENLTEADVAIRESWSDFLESATDKLPGWSATVAKNALITKDTALFQGLNRMVQYGDFVSKAVLYEHLTEKKGKSEREALDVIFEEFVAYNRLSGRGRDTAESLGLLWFYNYKLRIMKPAPSLGRYKVGSWRGSSSTCSINHCSKASLHRDRSRHSFLVGTRVEQNQSRAAVDQIYREGFLPVFLRCAHDLKVMMAHRFHPADART